MMNKKLIAGIVIALGALGTVSADSYFSRAASGLASLGSSAKNAASDAALSAKNAAKSAARRAGVGQATNAYYLPGTGSQTIPVFDKQTENQRFYFEEIYVRCSIEGIDYKTQLIKDTAKKLKLIEGVKIYSSKASGQPISLVLTNKEGDEKKLLYVKPSGQTTGISFNQGYYCDLIPISQAEYDMIIGIAGGASYDSPTIAEGAYKVTKYSGSALVEPVTG